MDNLSDPILYLTMITIILALIIKTFCFLNYLTYCRFIDANPQTFTNTEKNTHCLLHITLIQCNTNDLSSKRSYQFQDTIVELFPDDNGRK